MRSVLSSEGYSRTFLAGDPALAVGSVGGPAGLAVPGVYGLEPHEGVQDDHLGPGLEHLESGALGGAADDTLYQATQPLLLGLGLLEQRFVHPPLVARRRDRTAPPPPGPPNGGRAPEACRSVA